MFIHLADLHLLFQSFTIYKHEITTQHVVGNLEQNIPSYTY